MADRLSDIGVVWQTAPGPISAATPGGGLLYYSRTGFVIDVDHWAELAADRDYKVLAQTPLSETMWVSTAWLGIDHNFGGRGAPLIFETMVFDDGEVVDNEMYRYATEAQAYAGHEEMVLLMRSELDWRSA